MRNLNTFLEIMSLGSFVLQRFLFVSSIISIAKESLINVLWFALAHLSALFMQML